MYSRCGDKEQYPHCGTLLLITSQRRPGTTGNADVALDSDATAINISALAFLPEGDFGVSYDLW